LLAKFKDYLGECVPSPDLTKGFLAQYAHRKPRTLARYAATIKSFMKWYGEPMDDFRIKVPRSLPPYTEDSDVAKLRLAATLTCCMKPRVSRVLASAASALSSIF